MKRPHQSKSSPGCHEQNAFLLDDFSVRPLIQHPARQSCCTTREDLAFDDEIHGRREIRVPRTQTTISQPQHLVHPSSAGIDDKPAPNRKRFACQHILRFNPLNPIVLLVKSYGFHVVCRMKPFLHRREHERQGEPIGINHLGIMPESTSCDAPVVDARHQTYTLTLGNHPSPGNILFMITQPVSVEADDVVHQHPHAHDLFSLHQMAIRRHHTGKRMNEMRSDAHQSPSLPNRFAHPYNVEILQIAQTSVYNFQTVAGRPAAKIPLIDERDRKTAQCSVVGDRCTVYTAADDEDVILIFG